MNTNKDKSKYIQYRAQSITDNNIKYMCTYMLLVLYDEFFYYKNLHNNNITTRNEIYQRPNKHSYINPLLLTNNKGVLFNTSLLQQSQPNTSNNSSVNPVKIAPLSGGPMFQNNNSSILQTEERVY